MKLLKILLFLSVAFSQPGVVYGYLTSTVNSFCMEECSEYYIEYEWLPATINVIFPDESTNLDLYLNRFVEVDLGQEVTCVECSANEVESIALSDECLYPVDCFVDPCLVAEECQIFTPTECVANYCDGCYADFYYLDENLVDCNTSIEECDDIEENYIALHSGEYAECEYDIDCMPVWGHCDVGLGNCHYAINASSYPEAQIDEQVDLWLENECTEWVCDCMDLPYAVCLSGECELAYCDAPNPAGCVQTGCPEGFECIDDWENDCVSSDCDCTTTGQWVCDDDCNGGTCFPAQTLGDINNDSEVNVLDIVLLVGFILMIDEPTDSELYTGDVNSDGQLNVLDIVEIIQMILNPMLEACNLEPDSGTGCLAAIPMYYFNAQSQQCDMFLWGGCDGVVPFESLEECENTCE